MTCDDLKICHAMAHSRSNQLVVPLPTPVSLALKFHHLPMIWFVIGGPGEAGTILAMRALCEQAAVNSSRSLYIRRYRCSVGVRGPLISRLYARTANLVGLLLRFKGGKKLDDFSGASVIWLFSKCLVENTVVRHHCEPDHNGNKSYLRADAQHDTLFDPLV